MTQLDPGELIERMTGMLDTSTGIRRAADLIKIRGYNRHSGADLTDDDEQAGGISVAAAIGRIARDPVHDETMMGAFAGWLAFTGAAPLAGDADRIIRIWETVAPGQQRNGGEVVATMIACASTLVTLAETFAKAGR